MNNFVLRYVTVLNNDLEMTKQKGMESSISEKDSVEKGNHCKCPNVRKWGDHFPVLEFSICHAMLGLDEQLFALLSLGFNRPDLKHSNFKINWPHPSLLSAYKDPSIRATM